LSEIHVTTGKSIFIQLKFFSFDSEFIDMTVLTDCLAHDLLLQGIADVEKCMQSVYRPSLPSPARLLEIKAAFFRKLSKKFFFP
jgi:hypothetical protein